MYILAHHRQTRHVGLSNHRCLRVGICKTSQRRLQERHLSVVCCAQKLRRPAAGPAGKKKNGSEQREKTKESKGWKL